MSDLFTIQTVAYMDGGASNTIPATAADVRLWAAERGYALVPFEPTREMVEALRDAIAVTSRGGVLRAGIALKASIAAAQEKANDPTP